MENTEAAAQGFDPRELMMRVDNIDEALDRMQVSMRDLEISVSNQVAPPAPDLSELYKALAAANLEITNAEQDRENEFLGNRYATLASVMNAIREPLAKNGLAIIQLPRPTQEVGTLGLTTLLVHESGATIENYWEMPVPKTDPQGYGSAMTYMRRYMAMAIVGIAGATDDDAEGTKGDPNAYERITSAEVDAILSKADELFGKKADGVVARMLDKLYGVEHTKDIKAGEADLAMRRLENQAKRENKPAAEPADEPAEAPTKDPEAKDDSEADGPRKKSGMKPQGDGK